LQNYHVRIAICIQAHAEQVNRFRICIDASISHLANQHAIPADCVSGEMDSERQAGFCALKTDPAKI
jgi:hypothetical protein